MVEARRERTEAACFSAFYPFLLIFFIFWIVFGSFGMIAMLTGVISESMFEKNQARMVEARRERTEATNTISNWCREKFDSMEKNMFGEASKQYVANCLPEFEQLCEKH